MRQTKIQSQQQQQLSVIQNILKHNTQTLSNLTSRTQCVLNTHIEHKHNQTHTHTHDTTLVHNDDTSLMHNAHKHTTQACHNTKQSTITIKHRTQHNTTIHQTIKYTQQPTLER